MLTDTRLRSQVDQLWDRLWSGGLSNPLDAIEQFSYLLYLKRLDDIENRNERRARQLGAAYVSRVPEHCRWGFWVHKKADEALEHVRGVVFPWLRSSGAQGSSFERYMQNAEFKINKPNLLIEACKMIESMQIGAQNQDVQGDLYEYLLNKLNTAGRNGQFRTPRHIIRMMVEMVDPQPMERIGDLAAGTCGFLVNAYQYILEQHTSPHILAYDEQGQAHNLVGDRLRDEERAFLQTAFRGYDNDSGMTMLRIGSMNLMLHGIEHPQFFYTDTLSKDFEETQDYDVILMNPPFKGAVDKNDVNETLPSTTTKSELLFLHLIARALDMSGRCAVIVPDGVLFGSSKAHIEARKKLIDHNRLQAVVSMPSGVFKPYAGVSTAVLLFSRGGTTDRIWFYDMEHDGFSLDDKRQPVPENDIPDLLMCWRNREDAAFYHQRQMRLAELKTHAAPLKAERLRLHAEVNRLRFERVIASEDDPTSRALLDAHEARLAELEQQLAPLQAEMNQLGRQFFVERQQVMSNKYDLSASRYRQVEQDEVYYENPRVTLQRLRVLDQVMAEEMQELGRMLP